MKKVAGVSVWARIDSTRGVQFGAGPSSKVSAINRRVVSTLHTTSTRDDRGGVLRSACTVAAYPP